MIPRYSFPLHDPKAPCGLTLQRSHQVPYFLGFRDVPKCNVSIVRRGRGKLYCSDAKQAAHAGLPQVDTPHILDPNLIGVLVYDAEFRAHSSIGHRVFAPNSIQLNPQNQNDSEAEKSRPDAPKKIGRFRKAKEESTCRHDCQRNRKKPFSQVVKMGDAALPQGLFRSGWIRSIQFTIESPNPRPLQVFTTQEPFFLGKVYSLRFYRRDTIVPVAPTDLDR